MRVTIVSVPDVGVTSFDVYPPRDGLRAAGWDVDVVHPEVFSVRTGVDGVTVFAGGRPFVADAVFVRRASEDQLMQAFYAAGIPVVNGPDGSRLAGCKWVTSTLLARAGIPHVPSHLLYPGAHVQATSEDRVVKLTHGSHARNVHLLPAGTALLPVDEPLIVQPLVKYVADWRVLVANGEVVAWAERVPPPGEWRANLEFGARWESPPIPEEISQVALAAVAALRLDYGGVDVLATDSGPQVVELNSNPGFRGVWPLWGERLYRLYQGAVLACLARNGQAFPANIV